MVGYVLLIAFAIIMGGIVYYWMGSYIPSDNLKCPDGVSVFIEDYDCNFPRFDLTIKNNGKFNVDGYFLRGTKDSKEEIATLDLSEEKEGVIRFEMGKALEPGKSETKIIDLKQGIYSIEIIPIRYETINNKKRLASCSEAKIREEINCLNVQ